MSSILPDNPTLPPEAPSALPPPPAPAEADHEFPEPPTDLIDNDGEPLESDWHRLEMTLLADTVRQHMGERRDYFCGGNMFIYFDREQARNRDYRGPDFFFVDNVPLEKPRRYWAIWDADAERQRAEAERQRAEAERQRAEAAEAELARLRALLQQTDTKDGGSKG